MEGYTSKIVYSSVPMTARMKVKYRDTSDCVSLDEATKNGPVEFDYDFHIILDIHNPKSDNPDYKMAIVVTKDGTAYATGSKIFLQSLEEIIEIMAESGEEFTLIVERKESKNYKGKDFLICNIK